MSIKRSIGDTEQIWHLCKAFGDGYFCIQGREACWSLTRPRRKKNESWKLGAKWSYLTPRADVILKKKIGGNQIISVKELLGYHPITKEGFSDRLAEQEYEMVRAISEYEEKSLQLEKEYEEKKRQLSLYGQSLKRRLDILQNKLAGYTQLKNEASEAKNTYMTKIAEQEERCREEIWKSEFNIKYETELRCEVAIEEIKHAYQKEKEELKSQLMTYKSSEKRLSSEYKETRSGLYELLNADTTEDLKAIMSCFPNPYYDAEKGVWKAPTIVCADCFKALEYMERSSETDLLRKNIIKTLLGECVAFTVCSDCSKKRFDEENEFLTHAE